MFSMDPSCMSIPETYVRFTYIFVQDYLLVFNNQRIIVNKEDF